MKCRNNLFRSIRKIIPATLLINSFVVTGSHGLELKFIASKINDFGIGIFKQSKSAEENDIISPLSTYMALSITLSGAGGETAKQIAGTLSIKNNNYIYHSALREYHNQIEQIIKAEGKYELYLENGLWIAKQFPVKQKFIDNSQKNYFAEIGKADFLNNGKFETERINKWVAEKTDNKILNAIQKIDPLTVVLIINTLYFKAQWETEFDENKTEKKDFYLLNGMKEKVSMMYQTADDMLYFENDQMQSVCIPYKNAAAEMVIILPKTNVDLENKLSDENVNRWVTGASPKKVKLSFPKFKFENQYDLNEILKGKMPSAFGSNADFSGIDDSKGLYISKVLHKTYIDLDEHGTEAAAATSVELVFDLQRLKMDRDEVEMNVNHPFYFIIRERKFGGYLFIGKVNNPNLN